MNLNPPNWVRPIRPEEIEPLATQAEADRHSLIAPSHIFLKHGQPAGYASVGQVMLVLPWFDTRVCQARDSFYFINVLENLVANSAANTLCVPVAKGSPFEPIMGKLGYTSAGEMTVMFKKVS